MKRGKKIWSFLLTLCMLCTFIPVTAFAENQTEQQQAQQYYKTIKPVYPGAILSRTVNKTMLEERVELYGNE